MIFVGLAGWGDHDSIYTKGIKPRNKLREYSRLFSIVEVDSSFYAIQSRERFATWAEETPDEFQFIVKAYQGMTGHLRGKPQQMSTAQIYETFCYSLEPVMARQKLKAVLFQYPPWFDCTKDNVDVLRKTKERMSGIPCALEFRHQSWFMPELYEKTLRFMEQEGWIHSICDEPQAGVGSIPTVLHASHPEVTIIRMHGRNVGGWNQSGTSNWREVRYLYDYNSSELAEWYNHIQKLQDHTKEICVIFNNNSGGHAAGNAFQLMNLLHIPVPDMIGRSEDDSNLHLLEQLNLFDD